jgi:hypothetical protein
MKLTRTSVFALLLMGLACLCILASLPCMMLFDDHHPAMRCYLAAGVLSFVSGCLLTWDCFLLPMIKDATKKL